VDDASGFNAKGDTLFYEPYKMDLPRHQALLLMLWDDLGIPHRPSKQISGEQFSIIGIHVDPNAMSLSLS
ncbi:hypothetical protein GALMADRAFT_60948, partial [Galerina marginata CBS 339.88]